jgi:hypothetical protein
MFKYTFIIVLTFVAFFSCKDRDAYVKKPFFDTHKKYIGDSVFIDKAISRIVFIDSTYGIDSVVFKRYNNDRNSLKSVQTFKNGKIIFENINYFRNGNIRDYSFIDDDNENDLYKRLYDSSGHLLNIIGHLFFQGYITDVNTKTLEIKKGTSINYKIYYPNPPDCDVNLYVQYDDSTKFKVFKKSAFLNFLQTTSNDNDEPGTYKVNILLELKEKDNSIDRYSNQLFYKVMP